MCSRCPFQVLNAPLLFPKDDTDPPPRSWDAYWPRLCRRPTPPPQPPAPFVARLLPEPGIESSQMPPPFGSNLLCSPRTSHSEYRPDDIKMVWRTCADSVDSGWKFGQALLASRASRNLERLSPLIRLRLDGSALTDLLPHDLTILQVQYLICKRIHGQVVGGDQNRRSVPVGDAAKEMQDLLAGSRI